MPLWHAGMMSSISGDWRTPAQLYEMLDREFHFTMDAAPVEAVQDLLAPEVKWTGVVWLNPPYGVEIGRWLEKAFRMSRLGATVVCLVPARTDTQWWHDYCMTAAEIRFLRGRLSFERADGRPGRKGRAPFPSAVVIFRRNDAETPDE